MYSRHHRKVRVLFGLSDVLLAVVAFEAAYQTRLWLKLENVFYLTVPVKALLVGFAAVVWPALGAWLEVYDRLDSAHPRVILRNTFRQCVLGTVAIVLFQYSLRLDVSRPFIAFFGAYSWIVLCLFRLNAGKLVGIIRREFGTLHHVLIVGGVNVFPQDIEDLCSAPEAVSAADWQLMLAAGLLARGAVDAAASMVERSLRARLAGPDLEDVIADCHSILACIAGCREVLTLGRSATSEQRAARRRRLRTETSPARGRQWRLIERGSAPVSMPA